MKPWRRTFLRELAARGDRKLAAELAGVHRDTPYKLFTRSPSFRRDWLAAVEMSTRPQRNRRTLQATTKEGRGLAR